MKEEMIKGNNMQIFSFIIGMAFGAFFTILTIIVLSDMKEDKGNE